jgi:hypothetical protein
LTNAHPVFVMRFVMHRKTNRTHIINPSSDL